MSLQLYNTLTRTKDTFRPIHDNKVGLYSCGPTVYNFAHIGNFRAYMAVDILKRYLRFKGYAVKHIMNITDVDDKTIKGSQEQKVSLKDFTELYSKAFFEDLEALNIAEADIFPKATEHIDEMVGIIKKLLNKGIAYRSDDGSVYFDISKSPDYGKLSHTKLNSLQAGARVKHDQYGKEQAQDFALWKAYSPEDGDVFWDTEIGKGRPGWHIECSAMSTKYLGQPFDIHAGGIDLVFPHHENEIAQSEASEGKEMAKYWFHNEHLHVDGKKMSKSLGNFFTLRDLLNKGYNAKAIRYLLLSAGYRTQLNFTQEAIFSSDSAVKRLNEFALKVNGIRNSGKSAKVTALVKNVAAEFEKNMDDDLNISSAIAAIFEFVKEINTLIMNHEIGMEDSVEIIEAMKKLNSVLGVIDFSVEQIPKDVMQLVNEREAARRNKDWKKSDSLREGLRLKGYEVKDSKEGTVVGRV